MSRSGYNDDMDDPLALGRWRAAVSRAMKGKRGQAFLREALAALDAMPEKKLIRERLAFEGWQPPWPGEEVIVGGDALCDRNGVELPMGSVCLLGAVGKARGMDMDRLDPHDIESVAPAFGIAEAMARELVYLNDECGPADETPEKRWARMRLTLMSWLEPESQT